MTDTKNAKNGKGKAPSRPAAGNPQLSLDDLMVLLSTATIDPNRRLLATNMVAAFVAAADAATAMATAATVASEAALAVIDAAADSGVTDDEMPALVTPSPDDSDDEPATHVTGSYTIIVGGPHPLNSMPVASTARADAGPVATGASVATENAGAAGASVAAANTDTTGASVAAANAGATGASVAAQAASRQPEASTSTAVPAAPVAGHSQPWYTVTVGRRVGVFPHWSIVSPLVTGVSNACYAKHATKAAAQAVFKMAAKAKAVRIVPDVDDLFDDDEEEEEEDPAGDN